MRLAEADFMRCRTDIERLHERWLATEHYFHEEMVGHLLAAHILDLYDIHARNCLPEDFPTRAAELLRRFTEELASGSFRHYRNLDWYAEKLCVTPHYLSEICRRASGRSAGYFIDLFTLQEIAKLLADKRLSVAQIAEKLSFSSASYFTRYVKKHFGMSPKKFRNTQATL